MAGGEQSSQEKTEDATPRRLRDARKKGQVAKSKDLNTITIMIVAFCSVAVMIGYIGEQVTTIMSQMFLIAQSQTIDNRDLFAHIQSASYLYIKAIAPYLAIVLCTAIFIGFVQIGPIFSAEPMKMQAKRLNIVENVKNMAKITTLVELIKNTIKMVIVFLIAYWVIKARLDQILMTMTGTPEQAAAVAMDVLVAFMVRVFICFIAIAIIDVGVQRWHHKKQLRMSKDEVKREYKQDEGDPLIKSMRRQLHQEMAMGDARSAVAASDMIVTNPTQLAVAIKYNDSDMVAPTVVMKGQRLFAQFMREVAQEEGVPIMRNVPLAWALIELEIGDEIPEALYRAVAELLLIVYRMRDEQGGKLVPDGTRQTPR